MARTFAIALTLLVALSLVSGSPASATEPSPAASGIVAAQESPSAPDDTPEEEAWRGDVPIKGVIGGTAALLGVLTVVAVRREWVL